MSRISGLLGNAPIPLISFGELRDSAESLEKKNIKSEKRAAPPFPFRISVFIIRAVRDEKTAGFPAVFLFPCCISVLHVLHCVIRYRKMGSKVRGIFGYCSTKTGPFVCAFCVRCAYKSPISYLRATGLEPEETTGESVVIVEFLHPACCISCCIGARVSRWRAIALPISASRSLMMCA